MNCPNCGAGLNRLEGKDGHQVALVAGDGGRAVEARVMAAVFACPRCEFIGTKDKAVAA